MFQNFKRVFLEIVSFNMMIMIPKKLLVWLLFLQLYSEDISLPSELELIVYVNFFLFFWKNKKEKKMSKIRIIFSNCRHFENMHVILIILVQARITNLLIKKNSTFCLQTNNTTLIHLLPFDCVRGASLMQTFSAILLLLYKK